MGHTPGPTIEEIMALEDLARKVSDDIALETISLARRQGWTARDSRFFDSHHRHGLSGEIAQWMVEFMDPPARAAIARARQP